MTQLWIIQTPELALTQGVSQSKYVQVPLHVLPEMDPAAPNQGPLFLQHSESQPS